jgi:hypothetical protein
MAIPAVRSVRERDRCRRRPAVFARPDQHDDEHANDDPRVLREPVAGTKEIESHAPPVTTSAAARATTSPASVAKPMIGVNLRESADR